MANFLLKTLFLCLTISLVSSLQCLDSSNHFVDWFSSYKSPEIRGKSSIFKLGLALYYLDVNAPTWSLSQRSINDSGTALYNTLQQVYTSQSADIMYLIYNDERPNGSTSSSGGHTKGVLGFDGKSGFWLIHSVPRFPPYKKDGYSYPSTGTTYGQSFLCISLPYAMLGKVAKQLFYNQPHIYDYNMPPKVSQDFPVLQDVINRKKPSSPPWYSVLNIQSVKGQNFTSFAKATFYGKDLYTDLVAPGLKTNLLAETWMDGRGQLRSNCSLPYKVYNVRYVSLPGDVMFKRTRDHSKWATASMSSSPSNSGSWTCIGDINRMDTQFKRGGGTVCMDNARLWKTFRTSVTEYEQC